jgi:hypothetical protein
MTRIHDSRYPNGLAAIASMAPGPVRLMAGDAEGHHDRYRPDDDVGDAATDETRRANMLRVPVAPRTCCRSRRRYGRP